MSFRTRDPKPTTRPSWEDYWAEIGNENWLYARELIELSSSVRAHFASFVDWHDEPELVDDPDDKYNSIPHPEGWVRRGVDLDWEAAAKSADEWPASSTEQRLLALVLSLVNPDEESHYESRRDEEGAYEVWVTTGTRKIDARDLSSMGSWRDDVADILTRYIKGEPPRRH